MDNLRAVIKNLFCHISAGQILQDERSYDNISEQTFQKLGNSYIQHYSNNEIQNMYKYLESEFYWQNRRLRMEAPGENLNISGEGTDSDRRHINVFDALIAFDFAVLIEENCEPLCQYGNLLRWRDMITALEEDIFVTSFLAMKDMLGGIRRRDFFWKPVIGHNNYALNRLVAHGVAENHFHLKGSAPMFHLSWISLMNHVNNPQFEDILDEYDKNRLQKYVMYDADYAADGRLADMWRQAAVIRIILFVELRGISWDELSGRNEAEAELLKWLRKPELLRENEDTIQHYIDWLKEICVASEYDYVLCEPWLKINHDRRINEIISGERWFLYSMFMLAYERKQEKSKYYNLFYAYLVLKACIRREIIQANQNIGFDNFLLYQNRKELFVEGTEYEKPYIQMAVRDTILNQHIRSLEARITPKETMEANRDSIAKYDKWVCEAGADKEKEELKKKFFYVMHFIKEEETKEDREAGIWCRHFTKRCQVERQARAIAQLREEGLPEAGRIRGIDASSSEIVCRPEVFAQAFRYLKNHTPEERYADNTFPCKNLMATYHVGEDFLDVVDGLRAIDEAICFLNLRCGDRLGHALALGIDIDDWYQKKSYRILIDKMSYLDNIVWLYSKLRKYNIADCEEAKAYIEKRFHEYFEEIYMNNISTELCREIINHAKEYFRKRGLSHGYLNEQMMLDIDEYYDAWKLRGDAPQLYEQGYFNMDCCRDDQWDYYAVNIQFPKNYRIRYNPEAALLYSMYHYNDRVKKIGAEVVEIKVKPCIVNAIKKVRSVMQREIAEMGIGIETNPSSNYFIGSFRRYDKHPIVSWYNCGLTFDPEELKQCPQLQVSINTDDQGVFATYIENEYAYMALALEKTTDENGRRKYNRTCILQWLESIRRMGLAQSFNEET